MGIFIKGAGAAVWVLGVVLLIGVLFLLSPWVLMVVLGALAHIFNKPGLAIGFGTSILICFGLSVIGGFFKSTTSKS